MSILRELGIPDAKGRGKEELLYNLAYCYSLLEKTIERALAPYGLSAVKMNALLIVKHVGGKAGMSQAEITQRMIVSAGNVTRLVDRLEREDLVKRVAHRKDRRVNLICITQKGSDLLTRAWPVYIQCLENAIVISQDETRKITLGLEKVRVKMVETGQIRRIL